MSTVEVKASDLIGQALDWAVGEAIGAYRGLWKFASNDVVGEPALIFPGEVPCRAMTGRFEPSKDWSQGGPLIEAYKLDLGAPMENQAAGPWNANTEWGHPLGTSGPTPLIAACRAIVRAKLGDTVQIPAELA